MIRLIAVTGSMVVAVASLRIGLGLPPFSTWLYVPPWMNFLSAVVWSGAAIAALTLKD